jgi:hypothetical protein
MLDNNHTELLNKNVKYILLFLAIIFFTLFSLILPIKEKYYLLIIISMVWLVTSYYIISKKNVISAYMIFLYSYYLYGLSAPISKIFFKLEFPRYSFNTFTLEKFGNVYAVGLIGIIVSATYIVNSYKIRSLINFDIEINIIRRVFNKNTYLPILLAFTASSFYIYSINSIGSINTIVLSKGTFYGMYGDLYFSFLNTPLSYAAIIIYIFTGDNSKKISLRGLLLILSFAPMIMIYTITGERSSILSLIIVWLICKYYYSGIKLHPRILFFTIILTIIFSFMLSVRSWLPAYVFGMEESKKLEISNIIKYINPAESEFHCGAGNFSTYIMKPQKMDNAITYFQIPINILPRWVLPFSKPTEISRRFNQIYHPDLEQKNIGVGFSSWVEGYMNGQEVGVFFHFLLIGLLTLLLDYSRRSSNNIVLIFLSISTVPLLVKLNRASFANLSSSIFENFVVWMLLLFIVLIINRSIIYKNSIIQTKKLY